MLSAMGLQTLRLSLSLQGQRSRFLADTMPLAEIRRVAESRSGFDDKLWTGLSALGLPGLLVDEAHGGAGLGMMDAAVVVEAMGSESELMISSRDATALTKPAFEKHGKIVGAEVVCLADDFDLASTLFELNQPAVRVATRRVVGEGEADDRLPDETKHAAATRALAELVMELAE